METYNNSWNSGYECGIDHKMSDRHLKPDLTIDLNTV